MTIEQRVAKLERQNRWMKRGGGLALAAVACVVLIGQGKAKELPGMSVIALAIQPPVQDSAVVTVLPELLNAVTSDSANPRMPMSSTI